MTNPPIKAFLLALTLLLTIVMMGCDPRSIKQQADADPGHVYLLGLENNEYVFRFNQHTYRARCESSRRLSAKDVDGTADCSPILSFVGQRLPFEGQAHASIMFNDVFVDTYSHSLWFKAFTIE